MLEDSIIQDQKNVIVFTGNLTLKSNGHAVMGSGIAAEIARIYPSAPLWIGDQLKECYHCHSNGYDAISQQKKPLRAFFYAGLNLAMLATKKHFSERSSIKLIREGVTVLRNECLIREEKIFNLNFPGIGLGGLKKEEVLPIIEELPSNCIVWEMKK